MDNVALHAGIDYSLCDVFYLSITDITAGVPFQAQNRWQNNVFKDIMV